MNTNEECQSTDDDSSERRPNNCRLNECNSRRDPREVHRASLPDETSADKHSYRRRMKQLTFSSRRNQVTSQVFFFHFLSPRYEARRDRKREQKQRCFISRPPCLHQGKHESIIFRHHASFVALVEASVSQAIRFAPQPKLEGTFSK